MDFRRVGADEALHRIVIYDLDRQNGNGGRLLGVLLFLLIFATSTVGLRLYTRIYILKSSGWDDFAIAVALLMGNAYSISGIFGIFRVGLGRKMEAIDPRDLGYLFVLTNKLAYASAFLQFTSVYFGRASVILLILRFQPSRFMTRTYKGLFIVNCIFYVMSLMLHALRCIPAHLLWTSMGDMSKDPRCVLNSESVARLGVTINITLNVLTFCLPLQFLLRLDLRRWERAQLSGAFLIGLLSVVGSGMMLKMSKDFNGTSEFYVTIGDLMMWSSIEAQILASCASLPVLKALHGAIWKRYMSPTPGNSKGSAPSSGVRLQDKVNFYGSNNQVLSTRVESFHIPHQTTLKAPKAQMATVDRQDEGDVSEGNSYSVESFRYGATPELEPSRGSQDYLDLGAFSGKRGSSSSMV